jgi:hypothetical protein
MFDIEQKIVLITAKLLTNKQKSHLKQLFDNKINWGNLIRYANKNKTLYLLYYNMINLGLKNLSLNILYNYLKIRVIVILLEIVQC